MKKIKLKESDIERLVKKIIKEDDGSSEPQILFPDWLSNKLKDVHTKIGQGSIFAMDIEKVIGIAKKIVNDEKNIEQIANSSGTISAKINGIGYDLVIPIDKAKRLPNIQQTKTKKVEGQNTIEVPAIKTSAPLSTFKTNLLTIIVRPMKNDSDEVIPNSYIILSVFPGNPDVPRVSEWGNQWVVILPESNDKLKESNLKRFVKKIIKEESVSELDKSTYASAADKARTRGMGGLGNRFDTHAREHGNTIESLTFDVGGTTTVVNNIRFNAGSDPSFVGDIEGEQPKRANFMINVWERKSVINTYMYGDIPSWPSTVRDAKNYLILLNDNGVDTFGIRPKQITSGYVNENLRYNKQNLDEVGGYDSPMELGKHSSGYMRIITDKVDAIIDSMTELENILPEVMDDDLHASLDSFLEKASHPLESLNDEIENSSGRIRDKYEYWKDEDETKGPPKDNPF